MSGRPYSCMTDARLLFASTMAMCASDGGCARFVIRAEGMRAPFAGPVYIRARGRQSDWPMFARFLRATMAARRPSDVLTRFTIPAMRIAIGGVQAGAATAVSLGLSSDLPSDLLDEMAALEPSARQEETP